MLGRTETTILVGSISEQAYEELTAAGAAVDQVCQTPRLFLVKLSHRDYASPAWVDEDLEIGEGVLLIRSEGLELTYDRRPYDISATSLRGVYEARDVASISLPIEPLTGEDGTIRSSWPTMLDIVRHGLQGETAKVREYAELLVERLKKDGQATLAQRLSLVLSPCKFHCWRERELSLNGSFSSRVSAKYFNVSANKRQVFSVNANK